MTDVSLLSNRRTGGAKSKRLQVLFFAALACSQIAWNTYPQPPKSKPTDLLSSQNPGTFIPEQPEKFSWVTTDEIAGVKTSSGEIPAYNLSMNSPRSYVGTVTVGVEVVLEKFVTNNATNHYAVPATMVKLKSGNPPAAVSESAKQLQARQVYWISGNNIKATGIKK